MNFMVAMVLGLTTSLASLRPFGLEREVFWREASPGSGMSLNIKAYYIGKNLVEIPRIAILTFAILMTFYPLANPQSSFASYFGLCFAGVFMATGVPIIFSTSLDPKSSQLATVVFILVVNMFSGTNPRLSQINNMGFGPQLLTKLSYARYLVEALFTTETELYSDAWKFPPSFYGTANDSVVFRLLAFSWTENINFYNVLVMVWLGITFRIMGYIALICSNRAQRSLPGINQLYIKHIVEPVVMLFATLSDAFGGGENGEKDGENMELV